MRRYFDFTAVILIIQESEEVHDKTYAIEVSKYKAKRACVYGKHCSYRHSVLFDSIPLLMSSIESHLSNKPKSSLFLTQ